MSDTTGKIFAIGLNKTGTTSLARALEFLGYRSLHHADRALIQSVERHVQGARATRRVRRAYRHHDAFLDIRPLVTGFRWVSQTFEDATFIYNVRDVDSWLDSREKHVRRNQSRAQDGSYRGTWLTVDREAWREQFLRHDDAVREFFAGHPRFLNLDIVGGDGWETLAPFLGHTIPDMDFPHANSAVSATARSRPALLKQRIRRMLPWLSS